MDYTVFFNSTVDGHWVVFNNAATNICVQAFAWIYDFMHFGQIAGNRVAGLYAR